MFYYDTPGWDDWIIEAKVIEAMRGGYDLPPSPYPLLRPCNGATGEVRRAGGRKFRIAQKLGLIPWPKLCSVCGSTHRLQSHNECYFRPLNARPICSRCHRLIHRRFYDPQSWLALRHEYAYPGAWFMKIALVELTEAQARYLATLDDPMDARQVGARVA